MLETLIGVGAAGVLTWIGAGVVWAGKTSARISVVETRQAAVDAWLERVEEKLDRAIERRR